MAPYRDEGPLRLLLLALLWIAATLAVDIGALAVLTAAAETHDGRAERLPVAFRLVVGTAVLQLVLLAASWWRSGRVGGGDRWVGLGAGPVRRPGTLLALAAAAVVAVPAWAVAMRAAGVAVPQVPLAPILAGLDGRLPLAALVAEICLGAPLCEELFFRGWLWVGLRRRWGPVAVAGVTGTLWLLAHAGEGGAKPLFIVPMALLLGVARHRCGSVWASMALHAANNGSAVLLVLVARGLH